MLFSYESLDKFVGMDVTLLIPAIQLPNDQIGDHMIAKHIRKQRATGRTQDGVSFPLCLMISAEEDNNSYLITIWVYSTMCGLVVIDENSIVESCNHHFSTLMFGYAQSRILGQNIFKLIPNFGQEFLVCDARSQRSPSIENEESETETDHILMNDPFTTIAPRKDPFKICLDFTSPRNSRDVENVHNDTENDRNIINLSHDDHELLTPVNEMGRSIGPEIDISDDENLSNKPMVTSTPDIRKRSLGGQVGSTNVQQFNYNYADGKYKGEAVHCDGNIIDIVYTIYKHTLPSTNNTIYLVWICRDPDEYHSEDPDEEKQFNLTLTLNSITSTIENSIGGATMKNEKSSACASNTTSSLMMTSATAGTNTLGIFL
jgi:PAS domain containing serine/threonine kinase